jgi:hypothetical protein
MWQTEFELGDPGKTDVTGSSRTSASFQRMEGGDSAVVMRDGGVTDLIARGVGSAGRRIGGTRDLLLPLEMS